MKQITLGFLIILVYIVLLNLVESKNELLNVITAGVLGFPTALLVICTITHEKKPKN